MNILVILLLACLSKHVQPHCGCTCLPVGKNITTRSGFVREVLEGEQIVRQISGQTLLNGDMPEEGVLVEVYDNPSIALSQAPVRKKRTQNRVAACITNQEGEFCFQGVRPGKYELRSSKRERNTTSVIVVLVPKGKQNQQIKIPISVSN